MADFKLRASPRMRFAGAFSIDGVIGVGGLNQLAGGATARAVGQAALLKGVNLAGSASASSQAVAALLKGLRLSSAALASASASASLSNIPGGGAWNVGTVTLIVGFSGQAPGQFAVAATGPANYIPGGLYQVDPGGTALPSGVTLSDDGVLDIGSATAGTTNGVLLAYTEPAGLPTLTLHPAVTGTLPYLGTWAPNEGVVPSGYSAASPDDANLRGSVLSTWGDGSAKLIVVAGETAVTAGVTKGIRLRAGQPGGSNLTTARINAIVSTVKVNFGAGVQTLTLSSATPDRTWWASPRMICARYRLGCGVGALEAVIDIHAFAGGVSDRAFVEVVIENGRMDSNSPSKPAAQAYSNATIAVNDTTIATVSDPVTGSYLGNTTYASSQHDAFRAWYAAGWVNGGTVSALGGAADPRIEVTHDTASLQAHPLLMKLARTSNVNLQTTYQNDVYEPWSYERQRGANMGAPGDGDGSIGVITNWDHQYLQSGDRYVRRAVIANTLAALSYTINYRDTTTNLVPSPIQTGSKTRNGGTWPEETSYPSWKESHQPAVGLMGFLCQPSPCFIEIAQKATFWCTSWFTGDHTVDYWFQTRGRAWTLRTQSHAIFLTPTTTGDANVGAWKTHNQTAFAGSITKLDVYRTMAGNPLGVVWDYDPDEAYDHSSDAQGGFQQVIWQSYFLAMSIHLAAQTKILSGADQTALDTFANWICALPVRYVNEQTDGGYRVHRHYTTIGTIDTWNNNGNHTGPSPGSLGDWGAMIDWWMNDAAPAEVGPWIMNANGLQRLYSDPSYKTDSVAWTQENYIVNFWGAFCCAVERGVSGADTAWSRVYGASGNGNVTGMSAWLDGFRAFPTHGLFPRNK